MSRAPRLSDLPVIDDRGLRVLLPMTTAVVALESALHDGNAIGGSGARASILTESGELVMMPAATSRYVGVKLASLSPGNPVLGLPRIQGLYVLFDALTLTPRVLVDGVALTSWRAPAVSALVVRRLAPQRPLRVVVIGTGPQGFGHIEAMSAVRPVNHVTVVGRDRLKAERMAVWVAEQGHSSTVVAGSELPAGLERPIREADVVVCATTSPWPLFDSRWVAPDALVIAVGSQGPQEREVDSGMILRSTVVVENRDIALAEAGEFVIPLQDLEIGPSAIDGDLLDLVSGRLWVESGRPRLFKAMGEAWQDLVIASAAYDQLVERAEGMR
jgi:ornithine cyclodeaminase/alanine dehydrogenase-like protein (mu-crystallin family)